MIIRCAWCKEICGEKCPNCASAALAFPDEPGWCLCIENRHPFPVGAGGETHGICTSCKEAEMRKIRAANPQKFANYATVLTESRVNWSALLACLGTFGFWGLVALIVGRWS